MNLKFQRFVTLTIILVFVNETFSHVFQLDQCRNFDAEFSKITYGQRLIGDIFQTLSLLSLRECLTKCLYYLGCLSVNYNRDDSTCEILGNTIQRNISDQTDILSGDEEWNHFETNYDRKEIGTSCFRNNPCGSDKRCVDNCNGLSVCVPLTVESLHNHIQNPTSSSVYNSDTPAPNAFDGNEATLFHSGVTGSAQMTTHWLRAEFQTRVFIDYVVFVNRLHFYEREHNIDLKTVLSINGQEVMTWFGNTGKIKLRRAFLCMRQADGIYIEQPQAVSAKTIHIEEIWVYGAVL
eukprot:TCONS_00004857-protein